MERRFALRIRYHLANCCHQVGVRIGCIVALVGSRLPIVDNLLKKVHIIPGEGVHFTCDVLPVGIVEEIGLGMESPVNLHALVRLPNESALAPPGSKFDVFID